MKFFNPSIVSGSGNFFGVFSGSFSGNGANLRNVVSYTNTDTLNYINSRRVISGSSQVSFLSISNKSPLLVSGSGLNNSIPYSVGKSYLSSSNLYYSQDNIGVGLKNPSSKFQISGSNRNLFNVTNRTNSYLYVSGSGNVGVSTQNPTHKLTISGSMKATTIADAVNSLGTLNQVLSSTGNSLSWVNPLIKQIQIGSTLIGTTSSDITFTTPFTNTPVVVLSSAIGAAISITSITTTFFRVTNPGASHTIYWIAVTLN